MSQRVVITGLGAVTGFGLGWQPLWDGLVNGRSAIRAWQPHDGGGRVLQDFPVRYAAPVDREAFEAAHAGASWWRQPLELRARFGMAAALQAWHDAGLHATDTAGARAGVAIGSGVPERDPADMELAWVDGRADWHALLRRRAALNPHSGLLCSNDRLAATLAGELCLDGGPVLNLSTACAGAAHAIGLAMRLIRRGEADVMLAGGADSVLNVPTMIGLHLLGAPSVAQQFGDRLCRPFDRDRSGFVAAEGAGVVVLESERHARRRGATILAEVAGFGSALDAYRITAPHPQGAGAAQAMRAALRDARLAPQDIGCINAHGTSTPLNDPAETRAIRAVFADGEHYRRLAVTANKSMLGHLIAAAGGPELIATVLSLREGVVPPTLNLENPDPECDLDCVPGSARRWPMRAALSNSFGFGGLNAALALVAPGGRA
jgi:3-oxoacyl-[acyl-carrier-protein] synthase II